MIGVNAGINFSLSRGVGGGVKNMFCYLSSYFASLSLHKNFYDPRANPSGRKVCVVGGGLY